MLLGQLYSKYREQKEENYVDYQLLIPDPNIISKKNLSVIEQVFANRGI